MSMGLALTVDSERYKTLETKEGKDHSESLAKTKNIPLIELGENSCSQNFQINKIEKYEVPFKSIGEVKEPSTDLLSQRIHQAETFVSQRENIQKWRIDPSSNITRKEIAKESIYRHELNKVENKLDENMDKDKRIYKQSILANSQDMEFEPHEYIQVNSRTMKFPNETNDFEYKIVVNAYWNVCK